MISSVVVRLSADQKTSRRALDRLSQQPGVEPGELIDRVRLPVVIEARDTQEMEARHEWLRTLEGVEFVDVVSVYF